MPFPRNLRFLSFRAKVKLLLIGGLAGLVIGVAITVLYFSLVTFFGAQARGLNTIQEAENARKNAEGATAPKEQKKAQAG
jgi:hypothetical protein